VIDHDPCMLPCLFTDLLTYLTSLCIQVAWSNSWHDCGCGYISESRQKMLIQIVSWLVYQSSWVCQLVTLRGVPIHWIVCSWMSRRLRRKNVPCPPPNAWNRSTTAWLSHGLVGILHELVENAPAQTGPSLHAKQPEWLRVSYPKWNCILALVLHHIIALHFCAEDNINISSSYWRHHTWDACVLCTPWWTLCSSTSEPSNIYMQQHSFKTQHWKSGPLPYSFHEYNGGTISVCKNVGCCLFFL